MTLALTAAELQGWVAILGGLVTVVLGLLGYFNIRSRRDRAATTGQAFMATIEGLASDQEATRLAGAILLRRFFDRSTEQGGRSTPYAKEAVGVMAALLRETEAGTLQKLLADGLAYAPTLQDADLQGCNLRNAYLGKRPDRSPDLSRADFFEADLSGASLKAATARGSVFYRARMRGTVMRDADLRHADFREADLQDARFEGAVLAGACFENAKHVPDFIARLLGSEASVPAAEAGTPP